MIVGIDEVGRGCWAGPLVAGAVVLHTPITGLKDSKQLTRLKREKLSETIYAQAAAIGLGWVSARELDAIGLTEAVRLAMQRALNEIMVNYDEVIIDGNYNFLSSTPKTRSLIRADATIPAVSAASITAKVARDNWMRLQACQEFPEYGFDKHVGYGTKLHAEMLRLHGACVIHRQSFKPIRQLAMS